MEFKKLLKSIEQDLPLLKPTTALLKELMAIPILVEPLKTPPNVCLTPTVDGVMEINHVFLELATDLLSESSVPMDTISDTDSLSEIL